MKLSELAKQFPAELVETYRESSRELYDMIGIDIWSADWDGEENMLTFEFTAPVAWQAHPGVAHGGMIATVFDSVMGVLAMILAIGQGQITVTKTLSVSFIRPLIIGTGFRVTARLVQESERSFQITADLYSVSGQEVARAEGEFVKRLRI